MIGFMNSESKVTSPVASKTKRCHSGLSGRATQLKSSLHGGYMLFSNRAHLAMLTAGRMDDDWQLVSAASGSSMHSTASHQAGLRPTQQQGPHHQQPPAYNSASQHQSPVKGSDDVQNFPELARLSNEEMAVLLVDDTKYDSLVDSIMARSNVAQVCPSPLSILAYTCCSNTTNKTFAGVLYTS